MSKDNVFELRGTVLEVLPNSMFRIYIKENDHMLLAYSSGKIKQNKIKILTGDSVTVEVSGYDLSKGRITYRH
jgi:translation initiation factor IF-1